MGSVYLITCRTTGMPYVGKTMRTVEARWRQHLRSAEQGKEWPLQRAIRKYGVDDFDIEILGESESEEALLLFESEMIAELDTRAPNGYNLTDGGEGPSGVMRSEETRKKISKGSLGNTNHLGKLHSEESKQKNRDAHLGKKRSEEAKRKTSESFARKNSERIELERKIIELEAKLKEQSHD